MGGYFIEYANFEPANPLKTPEHIAPVWYFTPFYAMLRAITFPMFGLDAKFWGVVVMGAAIAILFVLPWLDRSPVRSIRYKGNLSKIMLVLFGIAFVMLGSWCVTIDAHAHCVGSVRDGDILLVLPCNALVHPLGIDETCSSKGNEMKVSFDTSSFIGLFNRWLLLADLVTHLKHRARL